MGLFGGNKEKRIDVNSFALKVDEVFQSVGKNIFDTSDFQNFMKQQELFRSRLTAFYMAAMQKKNYSEDEVIEFAGRYLSKNSIALNDNYLQNHYQVVLNLVKDVPSLDMAELMPAVKEVFKDVKMSDDMLKKTVDKVLKNLG